MEISKLYKSVLVSFNALLKLLYINKDVVSRMELLMFILYSLQFLSLCQCDINDNGAKLISSELIYNDYTTHTLVGLNLTHNQITCIGAQFFAEVSIYQY